MHKSVLLEESIENLNIKNGGVYVDATLGFGGHSSEILKKNKKGKLFCFDQDDYAISYVRLQPPMSSLWSKREKRMRTNTLVAEVSKDKAPWILTAVSRPMDITQLINQYRQKRDETDDPIRKQILKQETRELQTKVGAGEAIERQFFIKVWMNNKPGVEAELMDRARNIISAYESIGVLGHILKKPEIIRYCNLVHNPAYINMDDVSVDANMPFIFDVEEDAS